MTFEQTVLGGVSIHKYTYLLTKERTRAKTDYHLESKCFRISVGERINSNTIRVRNQSFILNHQI